jgi:quinol monooxygenase YgiN
MLVKVFIKRRFKEGKNDEIVSLLNEFRSGAMDQAGYVSGETLVSADDPQALLVIGTWQNMESWSNWRENTRRKNFEAMLEIYQESPTEYEVFYLGALSKRAETSQ